MLLLCLLLKNLLCDLFRHNICFLKKTSIANNLKAEHVFFKFHELFLSIFFVKDILQIFGVGIHTGYLKICCRGNI